MRLLVTSLPGYGHLCPLIPLARAVQAAGHEVFIATSGRSVGTLIPDDLSVFGCGPDWSEADFSHDTALRAHAQIALPLHKYLMETVVPSMFDDITALIERWRPDVILSNEYERTGCVLAEKHGIPFVLLSAGPRVSRRRRREWHAPLYDVSRRMAGLPPDRDLSYVFKWLHLYLTPVDYALDAGYQEADNEFGVRIENPDLSVANTGTFDQSALDAGKRRVLCTFGSVFNKNPDLISTIIEAFAHLPYQLIVVQGPGFEHRLESAATNVTLLPEYVPLSKIAPHVDLYITHGGTSTLLTLLQHGKPLLLLPQGADQKLNAMTCMRLGLAEADFVSVSQAINVEVGKVLLRCDSVQKSVDRLLHDSAACVNCQAMGDKFTQLPPIEVAVNLLEQLAETAKPLPRI